MSRYNKLDVCFRLFSLLAQKEKLDLPQLRFVNQKTDIGKLFTCLLGALLKNYISHQNLC